MRFTWLLALSVLSNFIFCEEVSAQKQNNIWYFGGHVGLDFNTSPPTPLKGEMNTNEGCASIADPSGALLFYTNGIKVWDRRHQLMPNGFGLAGGVSSTQSAIIVPFPNSCTQYYIFTTEQAGEPGGLAYSIIDMALNDGFGDVIAASKNTVVISQTCEKVTAVLHPNGIDIWIITHTYNSVDFYAFLLTENGLSTIPVISSIGSFHPITTFGQIGPVRSSHNGSKLVSVATVTQICEIFDFNSTTGVLSNPIDLYSLFTDEEIYGVEFSPNDSLLYLTALSSDNSAFTLSQINIFDPVPEVFIVSNLLAGWGLDYGSLQLGPDYKIYLTRVGASFLDVIHQPDKRGFDCLFEENGIQVLPDTRVRYGLPQYVPYAFCPPFSLGDDQVLCKGDTFYLGQSFSTAECPVHFTWFDGTSDPVKSITTSGIYWCEIMISCTSYRDSIQIQFDSILHSEVTISICSGEVYDGYSETGIYTDTLTSVAGCDSIRVLELTIRPVSNSMIEEWICAGYSFEGYTSSGIYRDTFPNESGCDSIRILRLTVVSCDPIIYYSLDACASVMTQGTHMDYSEFTPVFPTVLSCADVDADFLFRVFPEKHSCTPGVNTSPAMCVTTLDTCEYVAGDPASVILEFTIDPLPDSLVQLSHFEFYEKAPLQYDWIDGPSGVNNRPLRFGIRIFKNDQLVYQDAGIPTRVNWAPEVFFFTENEHFLVDSFAHFRIELLSYCRFGANSDVSVWDLDEFKIYGGCVSPLHEKPIIDGFVFNHDNKGMPNVSIELSTDPLFTDIQTARTDAKGYYSFSLIEPGNSYYLRGNKNDDPFNGVGLMDLIQIQKHLLGITSFTTLEQFVAADVNRSNTINVVDLVTLQKLLLGKINAFPDNTSWRFAVVPQDFSIPDLTLFQEIKFIEILNGDQRNVNFLGIKIGDTNGDARNE